MMLLQIFHDFFRLPKRIQSGPGRPVFNYKKFLDADLKQTCVDGSVFYIHVPAGRLIPLNLRIALSYFLQCLIQRLQLYGGWKQMGWNHGAAGAALCPFND